MSRSAAEGLRMMQGGVDRTGFADMYESLGDPLARIRANREAARQQALLDAMMEVDDTEPGDTEPGDTESDDLSMMQSLFGDEEGSYTSDAAVGQNAMLAANLAAAVPAGMAGSKIAKAIMPDSPGFFKSVGNVFKRKLPGMLTRRAALAGTGVGAIPAAVSLIPEVGYEVAKAYYPEQIGAFEEKVGGGIKSGAETIGSGFQSSIDYLRDLTGMEDVEGFETRTPEEIERDNEVASQYFMNPYNDGGRVGMFSGGVMNNLLGSSQMQNMMQQQGLQNQIYQQPTIGFQPMPNPTMGDFDFAPLPDPRMGMGTPPPPPATAQAYNPFVSNMPLYDPSTLGTGLPSTAGMTDPYFSYDPYSAAGAFDAPPANIGGFLSRKEIEDTFKDLDKFSLRAQEAKRKAAEEAAKKKVVKERDGGQGGGGDRGSNKTNGGSKSCFVKGTMLQMADGTEKEISTVELGDNTKGGIVEMTMQGLPQTIYNYKGVLVSGSHWVIEDNEFVAVEDSKHGVLTDKVEPVYTLKTSEHRMWINDIEFGDFETGSDDDWEPHFEAVRKKLNEELRSGHI